MLDPSSVPLSEELLLLSVVLSVVLSDADPEGLLLVLDVALEVAELVVVSSSCATAGEIVSIVEVAAVAAITFQ